MTEQTAKPDPAKELVTLINSLNCLGPECREATVRAITTFCEATKPRRGE